MKPLVSIITPSYNSEKFIKETIESVLNQTYINWELLIVDDCSTDESPKIIKEYSKIDHRIKYLRNEKNSGPAITRNRGLDIAKGKYIAFLDSDDFWDKQKLELQIDFMEKNNLSITHSDYFFTDCSGKIIKKLETSNEIDYKKLLRGNQFKTMTMMMKKSFIGNTKLPNIKHEDYAFFLDLLKKQVVSKKVPNSLAMCRLREKSVSSNKMKSAIWTWNIYRKYEKFKLVKSLYYFINYSFNGLKKRRGR
ncbi:glycosyltransferase family 2 protein [Cetobacterium somerae]|uniref:glycosyltransferase family 2 protein n=1 Tax=Cetobacterium somerae TaxID=188913 RepID=UPI00248E7B28|nr:glycosyltransferase family 2 protein [Cetobacterium somerae]